MDDVMLSIVESPAVDERALQAVVTQLSERSTEVVRHLQRARLSVLQHFSLRREKELMNWVRIGERARQQLDHFLQYLQAKRSQPNGVTECSPAALQRTATLVQRQRSELSAALLRASLALEGQKRSAVSLVGAGAKHAAVQSLLRTRAVLSVEVQKVAGALQEMRSDTESMESLHHSLLEVTGSMGTAKSFTKRLLAADKLDSVLLQFSAFCFCAVVVYIMIHRIFHYFPTVVEV